MIEASRDYRATLTELIAMRAAINSLAGELLKHFTLRCIRHPYELSVVIRQVPGILKPSAS